MEKEKQLRNLIENFVGLFGDKLTSYTCTHFKCEEKLIHSHSQDNIQISILVELEKRT